MIKMIAEIDIRGNTRRMIHLVRATEKETILTAG